MPMTCSMDSCDYSIERSYECGFLLRCFWLPLGFLNLSIVHIHVDVTDCECQFTCYVQVTMNVHVNDNTNVNDNVDVNAK